MLERADGSKSAAEYPEEAGVVSGAGQAGRQGRAGRCWLCEFAGSTPKNKRGRAKSRQIADENTKVDLQPKAGPGGEARHGRCTEWNTKFRPLTRD